MNENKPNKCFVCNNVGFQPFIQTKDYFLTFENFELWKCSKCELLITWPIPDKRKLQEYYTSENYRSHNLKEKSFQNFVYRLLRSYNLGYKHRIITKYVKSGYIIDVGCGTGDFLNYCKIHGWKTDGVEPNQAARSVSAEKFGFRIFEDKIKVNCVPGTVDVVTMWHSLEHIVDPIDQLTWNYGVLKKGGILVVALPNYLSWDSKYYGKYWAAYDTPRHLYHFSGMTIDILANKTGFKMIKAKPLLMDAFYISLLSEKYKGKQSNYLRAFFSGIKSNLHAKFNKHGFSSMVYVLKKT